MRAGAAGDAVGVHRGAPRALDHDGWTAVAEEERVRLLRLLEALPAEAWSSPTDCAGWDVHDVVAHLAGAAASNASLREMGRQGRLGSRLRAGRALVDGINDLQVSERRSLSPAELLADLEDASRRGVARRSRIPAALRAVPVPWGPPVGVRPVGYLMDRVYSRDAWMHRVDVARATGAPLELTAGHDGAVVEDVVAEWASTHGAPFDLELTGPAGGRWARGSGGAVLRLDAVEFARALSGRAPAEGLLAHPVPF